MTGDLTTLVVAATVLLAAAALLVMARGSMRRRLATLVAAEPVDPDTGLLSQEAARKRFAIELVRAERLERPLITWAGRVAAGDNAPDDIGRLARDTPEGATAMHVAPGRIAVCGVSGVLDTQPPTIAGITWQVHWFDPAAELNASWNTITQSSAAPRRSPQ